MILVIFLTTVVGAQEIRQGKDFTVLQICSISSFVEHVYDVSVKVLSSLHRSQLFIYFVWFREDVTG